MSIEEILRPFDQKDCKGIGEHIIGAELRKLIPEDRSQIDEVLKAEAMAFDFCENYPTKNHHWGTYFGPMAIMPDKDGRMMESPSIQLVTVDMLTYWEKRAKECTSPVLVARYSGLVYDFKEKITGQRPAHDLGRTYVSALIETAEGNFLKHEHNAFTKLRRAIEIASLLNDDTLKGRCKHAIMKYEALHAEDSKPGLWGYSFDMLVGKKNVKLTTEEEQGIIQELENKLQRVSEPGPGQPKADPWAAEAAAERLASYYRKHQKPAEMKRVLLLVGKAYDQVIDDAVPMQASGWLEQLQRLYKSFQMNDEAEALLIKIRELGPKVAEAMKPISHEMEIPKEQMDAYVSFIVDGSNEEVFFKIGMQFIPKKDEAKTQVLDLSKKAPTMYLFNQQLQDHKGRVVATIGSLEHDLEGHIVRQVSQSLSVSWFFLRPVIAEAIKQGKMSKEEILRFLQKSPVIEAERYQIIERALDAYFANDFLVAIHLLIPQIEEALRNVIVMGGGNIFKVKEKNQKEKGYLLLNLDEILRDPLITEALGEDFTNYFKVLFTDQRGWNMRNNVCHGIAPAGMFNAQTADRIMHALICLGMLRNKDTQ